MYLTFSAILLISLSKIRLQPGLGYLLHLNWLKQRRHSAATAPPLIKPFEVLMQVVC